MPTNIEIKAKASDWQGQYRKAQQMADLRENLQQEDIFFNCERGRLKLRVLGEAGAYLIFYQRPDQAGPKTSAYDLVPVADARSMGEILGKALGVACKVRKKREVFHYGQTRIHFDEVDGLGRFIELEVVLKAQQSRREGEFIARELMNRLGIKEEDLIEGSYADFFIGRAPSSSSS